MRSSRKGWGGLVGIAVLGALAAAVFAIPTVWGKPWSIDHFFLRAVVDFARDHSLALSYIRILEPYGLDWYNDELEDFSVGAEQREGRRVRRVLAGLRRYDRDSLSAAQRLSADVLDWFLRVQKAGERFQFHSYPVNQFSGSQNFLPDFMVNFHAIDDEEDARDYNARLRGFGRALDQMTASMQFRAERGVIPPRFVLTAVRRQVAAFVLPAADAHVLYTRLREGLAELSDIDPIAAVKAMGEDPRFGYPDTDSGRERILADYAAILDEAKPRLAALFGRLPVAPVVVERVPPFKEAGAAGAYYNPPALDGSRPGIFYANLRSVSEVQKFGMRTLAYHEAIPGHHFQIALSLENEALPLFRRILPFTAFVEGWALYAERLAGEQGFYPTPADEVGHLVSEMFRAVRLVVDTGIHARRWSRERAIAYMVDNTAMPAATWWPRSSATS